MRFSTSRYVCFLSLVALVFLVWSLGAPHKGITKTQAMTANTPVNGAVLFNMNWLEKVWSGEDLDSGPITQSTIREPRSSYEILEQVLKSCPRSPVVYPSEGYFYYKFHAGKRLISGNLRFCDIEEGIVHFGYFDEYDSTFRGHGLIRDGVNGKVKSYGKEVFLEFKGLRNTFRLDNSWKSSETLDLQSSEEFVSGVLDESGYYFHLLFNRKLKQFAFVLNTEGRRPEEVVDFNFGNGLKFKVGRRSRFVFLEDESGREILVGVHQGGIESNNYFDGPFDQVPPKLELRERLELAYPYVKGKIDRHGNFIEVPGTRVAISPYLKYETLKQFCVVSAKSIDERFTSEGHPYYGFTYEKKSTFQVPKDDAGRTVDPVEKKTKE